MTTLTADELAGLPVVDADSHIAEPPDLWTARMSAKKWGDRIPRVVHDERLGMDRWVVADKKLTPVACWNVAGWPEHPPSFPPSIEEADPGGFFAEARLERMDEYGVYAQALYPNLLAFYHHAFMALGDEQLMLECVRAYNDFLTDFASAAPDRFILPSALPMWDVAASVAEIERCHAMGHHGVLFIAKPYKMGWPRLIDPHWAPIFKTIDDLGWSVNFHVGFADMTEEEVKSQIGRRVERADYAKTSAMSMLNNGEAIAEIILTGLCHEYPNIPFVSVESGFGWMPSFVESLDWQWLNSGSAKAYPEREMPSFYFRRQVHGMFWFENETVKRLIDLYPDNVMFETDFPHPTSLSPGPASAARNPKDVVADVFADIPEEIARKVLYANGARVYGLELPRQ